MKDGYCLVVYDACRTTRAVREFVAWDKDLNDQINKSKYYPHVTKAEVFKYGYISEKSSHSKGSTVDVSIIKSDKDIQSIKEWKRHLQECLNLMMKL